MACFDQLPRECWGTVMGFLRYKDVSDCGFGWWWWWGWTFRCLNTRTTRAEWVRKVCTPTPTPTPPPRSNSIGRAPPPAQP